MDDQEKVSNPWRYFLGWMAMKTAEDLSVWIYHIGSKNVAPFWMYMSIVWIGVTAFPSVDYFAQAWI